MIRALAVLLALLPACVIVRSSGDRFDRAAALRHTADEVIVPATRNLEARAAELAGALDAVCIAHDDASIDAARDAYREALLAWNRTTAFGFGPAVELGIAGEVDFRPTRAASIEANLAAAEPITPGWIDALGVAGKGLPAIEYLLFAEDAPAQLVDRRCEYLAALGHHVARRSASLREAWDPTHAHALAAAGAVGSVYAMQADAYSALVTQLVGVVQRIKLVRLGRPIGRDDGMLHPDDVEEPYASLSIDAMIATLEGARTVFRGGAGEGDPASLEGLVRSRDPALATRVVSEIDAAIEGLAAIPEPLAATIDAGDLEAAGLAHDRVRALERTLASDVSSTIAITVAFTDSDGD